jgi:thymidylate kinase
MFTIALIGADGSGKTTIGRRLEYSLPLPAKYIYMGKNRSASNVMLPTTRLVRRICLALGRKQSVGPCIPNSVRPPRENLLNRLRSRLRFIVSRVILLSEECFRQSVAKYYQWRGYVVLFDRHFFIDFYGVDMAQPDGRLLLIDRIHGFMLTRVYARPDLVICLDAPADVLFERKGEGSVEALEYWREKYLRMQSLFHHFIIVDAERSEDEVLRDVSAHILRFASTLTVPKTMEWKERPLASGTSGKRNGER